MIYFYNCTNRATYQSTIVLHQTHLWTQSRERLFGLVKNAYSFLWRLGMAYILDFFSYFNSFALKNISILLTSFSHSDSDCFMVRRCKKLYAKTMSEHFFGQSSTTPISFVNLNHSLCSNISTSVIHSFFMSLFLEYRFLHTFYLSFLSFFWLNIHWLNQYEHSELWAWHFLNAYKYNVLPGFSYK